MKYAIIENNKVINVAVADAPLAPNWIASEVAAIGDTYDNGQFIKPPAPPEPVPSSITMRQCRLQLLAIGKLTDVDAAIAAMPSPQKEAAQIEWEYAATVERNAPLTASLGQALGLTEQQLDDLFIAASGL